MAGLFSSLKNLADGFFMEEEDTDDLPELERDKPVPAGALPVRSIRPLEIVTMVPVSTGMPDAPLMPLQRGSSSSCSWETTWTATQRNGSSTSWPAPST